MTTYTRILATILVVALVVIAGALVVGARQSSDTAKQIETLQKSVEGIANPGESWNEW